MKTILLIFFGGGLGCVTRFALGKIFNNLLSNNFPLATFSANILSCLIMGITIYYFKKNQEFETLIRPLLLIGFCGGLSTFSTFSMENVVLLKEGFLVTAILNIALSIIFCFGALYYLIK